MFAICRIEKLKSTGNIGGLNSHLTRTMDVQNADKELSHLNHREVGSLDLNLDIQKRLEAAKITPRKNAVLAVEHLLTASPEYFKLKKVEGDVGKKHSLRGDVQGYNAFKNNAIEWLNERYGKENVVNVTVHLDETTPHIHAIIVPIDAKGKLNARDFFGGRDKMREMQDSYAQKMKPLGLERGLEGSKAQHTSIKEFYGIIKADKTQLGAVLEISNNREGKQLSLIKKELETSKKSFLEQKITANRYGDALLKLNKNLLEPNNMVLDNSSNGYRRLSAEEIEKKKQEKTNSKGMGL